MPNTIHEGQIDARGKRFAILLARFNSLVTDRLLEGALDALRRTGADADTVDIIRVPGAWELPVAAKAVAAQRRHDALICLGAVVRGDTPHFDYVAGGAASGLASVQSESGLPVAFGVLTTNTMEQALDRAGGKAGNKGFDAAMTAIEMVNLLQGLRQ